MENFSTSEFKIPAENGRGTPPLPPSHFSKTYTNFPTVGQIDSSKRIGVHHRCPSESILPDGQPSWLDDLLNEPDIETETLVHKGHRRSASDSYAYLESSFKLFDINLAKVETKPTFLEEKFNKGLNVGSCRSVEWIDKEECSSQNQEGSIEGTLQTKPFPSKADAKRAKQQSAHRSRVRKLQYIDQLERTIQILQVGGSEIAAELEFVDQHNLILSMKNRSLKQRMDNLSQEQLIKQMEHDMLEKELGRLQAVYQIQIQQQQMQMQMQMQIQYQQMNPKMHGNRLKEPNSIRATTMIMNGPVHYE